MRPWNTAKQRRDDVGDALTDKFGVAAMMAADHTVGNDRRQQRFDRAEQGDGDGWLHIVSNILPMHLRDAQRETALDFTEHAFDGGHGNVEDGHQSRNQDDGHKRTRNFVSQLIECQTYHNGYNCDAQCPIVDGSEAVEIHAPFVDKPCRHIGDFKSEGVFYLG